MNASSHDTGMHGYSSTCTLFSGSSGYFGKVSERVIRWPSVVVKVGTSLTRMFFVLFFFPSALKQKSLWRNLSPVSFFIPIPSTHSHHRLADLTSGLTSGSVLDVSSMQPLIGTATLCLCVAAVTLNHDWRPARLLLANLRHTHSAQCFLNRIVTALVQAPSKQCSFPNCWYS